jgi:hypothetical protein
MMATAICIGLLPLVLLVVRVALVIVSGLWRLGVWLFEQPEGVAGATGRMVVLALLLHSVGLL